MGGTVEVVVDSATVESGGRELDDVDVDESSDSDCARAWVAGMPVAHTIAADTSVATNLPRLITRKT